jgi:predicted enzyme related to lactoylglutathione lyase
VPASWDLVTLDGDTAVLGAFWSAALGLVELEREDGDRWVVYGTPDGVRRIGLQRGAARPGGVHLDLACEPGEFAGELDRLTGLGAGVVGEVRHEPYGSIANLRDPAGYAFDLCAYHGADHGS